MAAGAGSSLPQALPAGAIGRGAKVANAALSASTRAGIGTAVTSAVVEMGDTAKDKGYSTHRDMAYDLATGAGLGLVSKGLPSSFSTEQIIANGGVSRILANSANRARTTAVNTATETGQEAVQGALESALNQQQKEGKIDWGKVGKDAGMEAAVGFGMAGGPAIVGNIKAAVGDVKGFRSTLKTDPNNKNYDPNYAYQVSAGKAAFR